MTKSNTNRKRFNSLSETLYQKYIEKSELFALYYVQTNQLICKRKSNNNTNINQHQYQHSDIEIVTEYGILNSNNNNKSTSLDDIRKEYDDFQTFIEHLNNNHILEYESIYKYIDESVHLTKQSAYDYIDVHKHRLNKPRIVERTINYDDGLVNKQPDIIMLIKAIANGDIDWVEEDECDDVDEYYAKVAYGIPTK